MRIGITERGDAARDAAWYPWVRDGNPTILITKNPALLHDMLALVLGEPDNKANVIVHCTITGMGGTKEEPNVPDTDTAIYGYKMLTLLLSTDRVVLRVDPIVPNEKGIKRALDVIAERRAGTRLRVSFMDAYPHVRARYDKEGLDPFDWKGTHAPLERRIKLLKSLPEDTEVCGEEGIPCIGCVSTKDCAVLGIDYVNPEGRRGQRPSCMCLAEKHELLSSRKQCPHGCMYCYWR